jgi:hypothetical protein
MSMQKHNPTFHYNLLPKWRGKYMKIRFIMSHSTDAWSKRCEAPQISIKLRTLLQRTVFGLNLGRITGYPNIFSSFHSVLPGEIHDSIQNTNPQKFTTQNNISILRRYVSWETSYRPQENCCQWNNSVIYDTVWILTTGILLIFNFSYKISQR